MTTKEPLRGCMDASCHYCGHRIGWIGGVWDQPVCPKCHHLPNHKAMEIENFRELMREMIVTGNAAENPKLARIRTAAGLSAGQAARLLGIEKQHLISMEIGTTEITPAISKMMRELYGMDSEPKETT